MQLGSPASSLRDPGESEWPAAAIEEALFCDGSKCGAVVFTEDGKLQLLHPHWHLIETGKLPDAGPRIYPIWGV